MLHPTSGLRPGTLEALHMCAMDKPTLGWLRLEIGNRGPARHVHSRGEDNGISSNSSRSGVRALPFSGLSRSIAQQTVGPTLLHPALHHLSHDPGSMRWLEDMSRPRQPATYCQYESRIPVMVSPSESRRGYKSEDSHAGLPYCQSIRKGGGPKG